MFRLKTNNVMDKEMDRKDFLRYTGVAFLTIIGVVGLAKKFQDAEKIFSGDSKQRSRAYGESSYGV